MKKILPILPWALMVLALAGAGAMYVLMVGPAKKELAAAHEEKEKATASHEEEKEHAEHSVHELEKQIKEIQNEHARNEAAAKALEVSKQEMDVALAYERRVQTASIQIVGEELLISMESQLLFKTGEITLHAKGEELLRRAAQALLRRPEARLQIAGHVEDLPVPLTQRGRFLTNWERAFGEAATILHFFEDQLKVPGEHLSAASFAQFSPVAPNKTADGRKRNHRITFRVSYEQTKTEVSSLASTK